jgi:Sulfotransferase family
MTDRGAPHGKDWCPEEAIPRLTIVCGHQRSGTTMLCQLLNTHPSVMITMEFRNFRAFGARWPRYASRVLWGKWNRDLAHLRPAGRGWHSDGAVFVLRFALGTLWRSRGGRVTLDVIRSTMRSILPWAQVVGDKYPGYVFKLDRLAARAELRPIVIVRDCRDVVASSVGMAMTDWQGSRFAALTDTPEKVARRWVEAVAAQERNASRILTLRYEDLVTRPTPELERLGTHLGVDRDGFRPELLQAAQIGRHRQSLTAEDLAVIEDIAGDAMRRWGYR